MIYRRQTQKEFTRKELLLVCVFHGRICIALQTVLFKSTALTEFITVSNIKVSITFLIGCVMNSTAQYKCAQQDGRNVRKITHSVHYVLRQCNS